jgi:undecaprenyl-diphosphatase
LNVQQSLVLGLIQGLTEFIPVSSTAHLILAPQVLNVPPPRAAIAHTYDTFIQLGTVIPVLIYFWRDWMKLMQAALRIVAKRRIGDDFDERMVKYIVMGSIPAGILGLLFEKKIEGLARPDVWPPAYLCIGGALILVGLLMGWVEHNSRKARTLEHVKAEDAWFVGLAQAAALFPGVSRSGATITGGLLMGLTREAAARFSFLLMTPIMLAATGYKLVKVLKGEEPVTGDEWGSMLLAAAVAGVSGYFAIAFLLNWLRTRSMGLFVGWRILVGAFSIGLFFLQQPSHRGPARPAPRPEAKRDARHAQAPVHPDLMESQSGFHLSRTGWRYFKTGEISDWT